MDRKFLMWIVIGILFLAVLFLTFKANSLGSTTGNSVDGKIDTTGWTENELMNYEMHGVIPARFQGTGAASSSSGSSGGMVGGC